MSPQPPVEGKGLLSSVTTMATTLVAIAHTRLDLLSTDLEEDRQHLLSLLLLALTALFCLGIGVVMMTIMLVAAFWETHRLLMIGFLAGSFLAIGGGIFAFALHKAKSKPRLFSASLLELFKDRQHLDTRHEG
jgi:uncharacterized membrane protein YqjE